jgi:hypothetical protein
MPFARAAEGDVDEISYAGLHTVEFGKESLVSSTFFHKVRNIFNRSN